MSPQGEGDLVVRWFGEVGEGRAVCVEPPRLSRLVPKGGVGGGGKTCVASTLSHTADKQYVPVSEVELDTCLTGSPRSKISFDSCGDDILGAAIFLSDRQCGQVSDVELDTCLLTAVENAGLADVDGLLSKHDSRSIDGESIVKKQIKQLESVMEKQRASAADATLAGESQCIGHEVA